MAKADDQSKFRIRCPNADCGQALKVGAETLGRRVKCPKCGGKFSAELEAEEILPEAAPRPDAVQAPEPAAASRREAADAGAGGYRKIPTWIDTISGGKRKLRTAITWALVASFLVHLSTIAPVAPRYGELTQHAEMAETEYQKKIMRAKTAGKIAREMKGRITMPPPPPDPEGVVNEALAGSLTSDITKITDGLLSLDMQDRLAQHVKTSLADELAAASKDIADGKLSEEEIKALHKKFQLKAQQEAINWRDQVLEETQVERAMLGTSEWYGQDVAPTLFGNMKYELFHRDYGQIRWHHIYGGQMGRNNMEHSFYFLSRDFGNRLQLIGNAIEGKRFYNDKPDASWPGPNKEQAAFLAERLDELYSGAKKQHPHNYAPGSPWSSFMEAAVNLRFPHKEKEIRAQVVKPLDDLWQKAIGEAGAYLKSAESGADENELKGARDAVFETLKQILEKSKQLGSKNDGADMNLNYALRTAVLAGPALDEGYTFWADGMVADLSPLVRDFFKSQFKKGIIKKKDGVDDAMKEFVQSVVPLLREDIEKLIPKKIFAGLIQQPYCYRNKLTNETGPASAEQLAEAKQKVEAFADKAYIAARSEVIKQQYMEALAKQREALLEAVLTGGLMIKSVHNFVEGWDTADRVKEKLDARAMAMQGRGQDLAGMTKDGVPDTSAPMVALMFGASKGHGANLQPVETLMVPEYVAKGLPEQALRYEKPIYPPVPELEKGPPKEQAKLPKPFPDGTQFECIPFMARFPSLDGDTSDWGEIRPLNLKTNVKGEKPVLLYAAWNYQGFFFGYKVERPMEKFYYVNDVQMARNHNTGDVWMKKAQGIDWAFRGDYLRLFFDSLDARRQNRGEPHTQEFLVFPMGTETDPIMPGVERVIASQRDAKTKEYRGVKDSAKYFPSQPPLAKGPDGSGPYRITSADEKGGYVSEVFIPRSLLNVPVLAPGWYIGFDASVATGTQGAHGTFNGAVWASRDNYKKEAGHTPHTWGDVLLLGTDPRVIVQNYDGVYNTSQGIIPGHSYLLTVIDPDRNVYPSQIDSVLVSAEVRGGDNDVEVFILKENKENSGIFRGVINTQPGQGREVQAVLEAMPGQEVGFGYVDIANSKGERKLMTTLKLPVVSSLMHMSADGR